VINCLAALRVTDTETVPKVFSVRSSADVAPTTSPVTFHQRHPISEATITAPQVKLVQSLICEARAVFADKIPINSLVFGIFKYIFVSPSGSVLNPTGGHFGEGEGESFTFFFFFLTGAFFFTGAFFVGLTFGVGVTFFAVLALGVGVGLFVAAVAGEAVIAKPSARASANFLDLIIAGHPT
jgi:hypothetical protein